MIRQGANTLVQVVALYSWSEWVSALAVFIARWSQYEKRYIS